MSANALFTATIVHRKLRDVKTVILLLVLAFSCDVAAQKPKPKSKPEPADVSQKIQGTVAIRNNDGSVRPAPFVQIHIYEPQRDGLTDLIGAWKSVEQKAREGSKGLSQFADTCQEVVLASLAAMRINATYKRAEKSRNWDEVKELGLAQYDNVYTDKDGTFNDDLILVHGNLLVIAILQTPTRYYYWEEQITVRQGEKTTSVVLADPVVCDSTQAIK